VRTAELLSAVRDLDRYKSTAIFMPNHFTAANSGMSNKAVNCCRAESPVIIIETPCTWTESISFTDQSHQLFKALMTVGDIKESNGPDCELQCRRATEPTVACPKHTRRSAVGGVDQSDRYDHDFGEFGDFGYWRGRAQLFSRSAAAAESNVTLQAVGIGSVSATGGVNSVGIGTPANDSCGSGYEPLFLLACLIVTFALVEVGEARKRPESWREI
jgi:hypothetical protein